jgi:hypothetical protein
VDGVEKRLQFSLVGKKRPTRKDGG